MRQIIELTHADIVQTIADHYDVDCGQINLIIKEEYLGYGPMEHEGYRLTATITLKEG